MERIKVESSNIASVGYSTDRKVLEVEYIGGGVYEYLGVPLNTYDELLLSPSKGKYLNSQVKKNFPYKKLLTETEVKNGTAPDRGPIPVPGGSPTNLPSVR